MQVGIWLEKFFIAKLQNLWHPSESKVMHKSNILNQRSHETGIVFVQNMFLFHLTCLQCFVPFKAIFFYTVVEQKASK